jgi:hypothetical protein
MQTSHTPAAVSAAFDDRNLIAQAGLVPVMRLAEQCGLTRLVAGKVRVTGVRNGAGAVADAKVTSIVAGMAAGADSIDDLDVLRHGAMPAVFGGVRAPPPWVPSCAPSPVVMPSNSTRRTAGSWPHWPRTPLLLPGDDLVGRVGRIADLGVRVDHAAPLGTVLRRPRA